MKLCDVITKLQEIEDARGSDVIVLIAMPDLGEYVPVRIITTHETKAGLITVVIK
jgi:hypothetical protein